MSDAFSSVVFDNSATQLFGRRELSFFGFVLPVGVDDFAIKAIRRIRPSLTQGHHFSRLIRAGFLYVSP